MPGYWLFFMAYLDTSWTLLGDFLITYLDNYYLEFDIGKHIHDNYWKVIRNLFWNWPRVPIIKTRFDFVRFVEVSCSNQATYCCHKTLLIIFEGSLLTKGCSNKRWREEIPPPYLIFTFLLFINLLWNYLIE